MLMVTTGGIAQLVDQERLQSANVSKSDLQFSPDLPNPTIEDIPLDSFVDSSNVRVDDSEDVNGTDYVSDKVLRLSDNTTQGSASYRVEEESEVLNVKVTNTGLFESSEITLEQYSTLDNSSLISSTSVSNEQSVQLNSETNFVRFLIDPSGSHVYEIEQKSDQDQGFFATITAYANSAANAVGAWFKIVTGLPPALFWIGAVFTILGAIIVIEIVLW